MDIIKIKLPAVFCLVLRIKSFFHDLGDQILNGRLGLAPHRNFNNISSLHPDVRTGAYNQSFGMPAQHEFQTVLEKRCDRHKNIIVQLN